MNTIPCRVCGAPTPMMGTALCDPCWHGRICWKLDLLDDQGVVLKSYMGTNISALSGAYGKALGEDYVSIDLYLRDRDGSLNLTVMN